MNNTVVAVIVTVLALAAALWITSRHHEDMPPGDDHGDWPSDQMSP